MNKDFINNPEKTKPTTKPRLHMKELLSGLVSKLGCPILEMLGVISVSELSFYTFPLEMGYMSKHKMFTGTLYRSLKAPGF